MSGHRRPWLTSLLALLLGLGGFGLMSMSSSPDDFSGWPPVISAVQLLWLWTVDLRGDDQARRMSLVARITASFLLGVAGWAVSAGALFAVLHMAVRGAEPADWDLMLALLFLIALLAFTLLWGRWAWGVSETQAPQVAVRSMLARLTAVTLPALGLGYVACFVARESHIFVGAILVWFALIGPLVVLGWISIPWLELLLSARARDRKPGAAQPRVDAAG